LRPGLLQKSEACNTSEGKFQFKAFLLDLQSLSSIQVEAEWEEKARRQDTSSWIEVPPPELRKTHVRGRETAAGENPPAAKGQATSPTPG